MTHFYDPDQMMHDLHDVVDSMPYGEFADDGQMGDIEAGINISTEGVRTTASGSLIFVAALLGGFLFAKHKGWV